MNLNNNKFCDILDKVTLFSLYAIAFFLPISKALIETFSIIAILSFTTKKIVNKEGLVKTRLNIPIFIYLAVCFFSILLSSNLKISARTFFAKTLENIAIFWVVIDTLNSKERIRNFLLVLFASALLLSVDGIYQYYTFKDFIRNRADLYDKKVSRITASFLTPNAFGSYLATVLPFVISCFFIKAKKHIIKIMYACLFALLFICLLLTVSRGAWFAFISCAFFMSIWLRPLGVFFLIIGILIIATYNFYNPMLKSRIGSFFLFTESDIDRKLIWQAGCKMFIKSPWIGLGLGTFMFNFKKFIAENYQYCPSYAHNCYLQMLSEIGIVGLFSFLLLPGTLFYYGIKFLNSNEKTFDWYILLASLTAALGYMIQMGVDTTFYSLDLGLLFWLVLGLGVVSLKGIETAKMYNDDKLKLVS